MSSRGSPGRSGCGGSRGKDWTAMPPSELLWAALLDNRERALRVARARCADPHDAEDCAQEALARVAAMPSVDLDRIGSLVTAVVSNLAATATAAAHGPAGCDGAWPGTARCRRLSTRSSATPRRPAGCGLSGTFSRPATGRSSSSGPKAGPWRRRRASWASPTRQPRTPWAGPGAGCALCSQGPARPWLGCSDGGPGGRPRQRSRQDRSWLWPPLCSCCRSPVRPPRRQRFPRRRHGVSR